MTLLSVSTSITWKDGGSHLGSLVMTPCPKMEFDSFALLLAWTVIQTSPPSLAGCCCS